MVHLYLCLPDRCGQNIHKSKKDRRFLFAQFYTFCLLYSYFLSAPIRQTMETRYKDTNLLWPYFTKHEIKFCQRYYKPRCGEWPRSGGTIYIEHHSFLGIEVLPSSQLSAVSMATRVSRSVLWIRKHGDARKYSGDFGSLLISSIYSIYEIK